MLTPGAMAQATLAQLLWLVSLLQLMPRVASRTEWTPQELEKYRQSDPSLADKLRAIEITLPTKTFETSFTIKDKGT
jgi:hypothetical protein